MELGPDFFLEGVPKDSGGEEQIVAFFICSIIFTVLVRKVSHPLVTITTFIKAKLACARFSKMWSQITQVTDDT